MKVQVLQHASFEGLGNIEAWLHARGAQISTSRLYESPALPAIEDLAGYDLLIALGGPMSVNDEAVLPWLAPEKQLIAAAIERGIAVLGVCLGAQLIAAGQGARVYAGHEKEIGWHAISGAPRIPVSTDAFQFPAEADVFHWHGETFDLPAGAVLLASSASCANQAFQLGSRTIGLQFHVEVTRTAVSSMLEHGVAELTPARYVQSADTIRSAPDHQYATVETLMSQVLGYLVG